MLQLARMQRRLGFEPGFALFRELKLAQRHESQAILGADIHATAAENAFGAVLFVALENGIDPALQAARSFAPSLLLREARFDFGDAGAAVDRQNREQAGASIRRSARPSDDGRGR